MDKYIEADIELAKLLGYTFRDFQLDENYQWYDRQANPCNLPRWTLDDNECFRLEVANHVVISDEGYTMCCAAIGEKAFWYASYKEHNYDRRLTERYAIVQAVIAKLKGKRDEY